MSDAMAKPDIDDLIDDLIRTADARGWAEARWRLRPLGTDRAEQAKRYERACRECNAAAVRLREALTADAWERE